jgi:hypothetical protein
MNSPRIIAVAPHTWWPRRSRAKSPANARRVLKILHRHFEHLLDLMRGGVEGGTLVGDADDRVQRESADEHVYRRQLAEHAHPCGIHADFFECLAQRRLGERLAWIGCAPRKADLTCVALQAARADRQGNRRAGSARIHEQESRRGTRVRGELTGHPAGPRRRRHEPALRVESR